MLPNVHCVFFTRMDGKVFVCLWGKERERARAKEYECVFIPASFTLVCRQGQPDTCQCNEASGVWVPTGVVQDVCVWAMISYKWQMSVLVGKAVYVPVRLRSSPNTSAAQRMLSPPSSPVFSGCVTFTGRGHCPPRASLGYLFLHVCVFVSI